MFNRHAECSSTDEPDSFQHIKDDGQLNGVVL